MSAPTPQSPASRPGGPPRRTSMLEQSSGDMVRSVFVLLLIVGAVWAVGSTFNREDPNPPDAVRYSGQLSAARDLADYPVLAPRGLDAGWVPTSVELQESGGTVRWHLGFLSPDREYVGLEQADVDPDALAQTYVGDLRRVGTVTVSGRRWQLHRGETDTALVRRDRAVITIVVGTAPTGVLTGFTASLG